MESDEEIEGGKTYTTLKNMSHESMDNSLLQFETFFIAENEIMDSDDDCEETFAYSDDSNGSEEEESNTDDTLNILSNTSRTFSLISEDWKPVKSSQNSLITEVMTMNRNEKFMLLQLFHKIKGCLVDIQNKIKPLQKLSERNEYKECHTMYLGQMGAPYFKTKKNMFCHDPNADTLDRRKRGILTIHQIVMPSRWSQTECENLTTGVKISYSLNKKKALLNKIESIKRKLNDETDSKITSQRMDEIELLEGQIRNLDATGMRDCPPLSEDRSIDWDHISTKYLMGRHKAQECSAFWNIYLHPDINKSNWSSEENENIKSLAEKHNKQNWDQIAVELGTNRTGFTVFLHYSSVLCSEIPKARFTEEEDRILLQQIESKKIGSFIPWNTIEGLFPNRSKFQLLHRYKYFLDNAHQYSQEFTDAEDILILLLVEHFGRNYIKFTKYLPSKSYMQIKSRYDNHLRVDRKKGSFTIEEDEQILYHLNNVNSEIGPLTIQLNRNRNQLRQRYRILKEFFHKHPNETLQTIPRRSGKMENTSRRLEFLRCIVDQFKEHVDVPSIDEIKLKLGKPEQSRNEYDIDSLLVKFFSNSYSIKQKPLEVSAIKIKNAAESIYNIMKVWGVNLQIPSELQKNVTIDIVDLEILDLLRDKYPSFVSRPSINDLLPPNMNSLIGFRGLLLTNRSYKKVKSRGTLNNELRTNVKTPYLHKNFEYVNISNHVDTETKKTTNNEKKLFLYRFISMFMWPALLSLECPNIRKEVKNSEPAKISKTEKGKNKTKKRKLEVASNTQVTKKNRSIVNEKKECNQTSTSQQTRFSSRLKNKKQSSKTDETTIGQTISPLGEYSSPNEEVEKFDLNKLRNITTLETSRINLSDHRSHIIPSNLIKIEKSEMVKKLLQKKKLMKIYPIQSIRQGNSNVFTIAKPSDTIVNENMKGLENLKKLGASDLVALADSIKNKCGLNRIERSQYSANKQNNVPVDLNKMKNTLKNSFKNNLMGGPFSNKKDSVMGNQSKNSISGPTIECSTKDHCKDTNPAIVVDKCSTDLTENEVMKHEIEKLDRLIKMENDSGSW